MRPVPIVAPERFQSVLDIVPMFLRTRWPLARFYWQDWQIDAAKARAEQLKGELNW